MATIGEPNDDHCHESNAMIDIDGSVLEGGGQAGRTKPGLKAQHLAGIELVQALVRARLTGGRKGSTEIILQPGSLCCGTQFTADPGTAGSICLIMQIAIPVAVFAPGPCLLSLRGGTNADMAPQIDYLEQVFLPVVSRMGLHLSMNIQTRGYFPKGGGRVQVETTPVQGSLQAIDLTDFGTITKIHIRAFTAGGVPQHVGKRMATAATKELITAGYAKDLITCDIVHEPPAMAIGSGTGILIKVTTSTGCILGSSALGRKGLAAEAVGKNAATELIKTLKYDACVDEWLQDQLVIFMALAKGDSRVKSGPLTMHTQTAIHIVEKICGKRFVVTPLANGGNMIECSGLAYVTRTS